MDFAEQIESVAYVVCGEGTVPFDKFRKIWQVKGVNIATPESAKSNNEFMIAYKL